MHLKKLSLYAAAISLLTLSSTAVHAAGTKQQLSGDAARCAALASVDPGDNSQVTAELVPAAFPVPNAHPMMGASPNLKTKNAFCRVQVTARPDQSEIHYEVWMPIASKWNGRFFGVGAGGFGGDILYASAPTFALGGLSGAMDAGYAAMASDYGHRSSMMDLTWAAGNPQQVADFGYRAVHVSTKGAKLLTAKFYGRKPNYSYWNGCSRGGAMAMVNAQRWYTDYDGIVAGNPARDWVRSLTSSTAYTLRQVRDPLARIPRSKLPFIHKAVLDQCDALDGVKDGIVSRAGQCRVDVRKLTCSAADSDQCLTAGQADALAEIYTGIRKRNGDRLADPYMPGAEANLPFLGMTSFAPSGTPSSPTSVAQFWSSFVYENPSYDPGAS
ncbi:MAG: tannase/feruloyl esterase family alpha/beta hydrolase, partial [Tabrizicola sp.]|nr:tannase/feruloyl esterase family alpha/beta hydrolase [Tabrizicola sp.]